MYSAEAGRIVTMYETSTIDGMYFVFVLFCQTVGAGWVHVQVHAWYKPIFLPIHCPGLIKVSNVAIIHSIRSQWSPPIPRASAGLLIRNKFTPNTC